MPKVPASSFLSLLMNEYEYVIGIRSIDQLGADRGVDRVDLVADRDLLVDARV